MVSKFKMMVVKIHTTAAPLNECQLAFATSLSVKGYFNLLSVAQYPSRLGACLLNSVGRFVGRFVSRISESAERHLTEK